MSLFCGTLSSRQRSRLPLAKLAALRRWLRSAALTRSEYQVASEILGLMLATGNSECFPKHGWIAARIHCSVSTVQRALAGLYRKGVLERRQRTVPWGERGRKLISSLYWFAGALACKVIGGSVIVTGQGQVDQKKMEDLTPLRVSNALLQSKMVRNPERRFGNVYGTADCPLMEPERWR